MGKRKVKEYSADFKTKVILEVLRQDQTQAKIASKYQISSPSHTEYDIPHLYLEQI